MMKLLLILLPICCLAVPIQLALPNGETLTLDVPSGTSLHSLLAGDDLIFTTATRHLPTTYCLDEKDHHLQIHAYHKSLGNSSSRDYTLPVSQNEIHDIRYIIKTLANKSAAGLLMNKAALESAGDRIDHLHPFRFLQAIFSDEELKVCMRNLKGYGWSGFIDNLSRTFDEEVERNNVHESQARDFAKTLKIDPAHTIPHVQQRNWTALVKTLIKYLPRQGSTDRYN
ncbi:MAG: hypothetical protein KDK65_06530, partial [Chlamydiia bacterium]|nr:hypothetical protein [Chlamydiia bacterium]